MEDFFLGHAIRNVWCSPEQDNQLVIKACKISKPLGELNNFKLMQRPLKLPVIGKRYHVYQIGQINPSILGLLSFNPTWLNERWVPFSNAINTKKLFINLYTSNGVEIPKFNSYYMFTNDKDLIFAIEENVIPNINLSTEDVYLRVYTNAFYQSTLSDVANDYLYCEGGVVNTTADILAMQIKYNTYASKQGYTFAYKNGFIIDRIDLINVSVNDVVEFIYDSSVKKVVTLNVDDLYSFNSELDNCYKYLLHYNDGNNNTLDFHDDIDLHVIYQHNVSRFKGLYYNRNNIISHRMVTHKDYSIPVEYYNSIANSLKSLLADDSLNINTFKIQLVIRESGYDRPLIFDNSRIFELYKLADVDILAAMVGLNSTMLEWKASNLENSAYTELMGSKYQDINIGLVQDAYGYNSMSKLVGDTPIRTEAMLTTQVATLPYGLQNNSTIYEYDTNGYLLGYHTHEVGSEYVCADNNTRTLEVISGKGTSRPDVIFGTDNLDVPIYYNYKVYQCYLVSGIPDNNWVDITNSNLYTVNNRKLHWTSDIVNQYLMIRTDMMFLAYSLELSPVAGNFYFTLAELEDRGNGIENFVLPVPLGELDIFLNKKPLIAGLDYIVQFPKIYITNKSYLVQPANTTTQHLDIRYTGFCSSDLKYKAIGDYGFIEHGTVSNNDIYNLRDDKVLRIVVDGSLKHRDQLVFSETHVGSDQLNASNGKPYQIKDIVIPLKQLLNTDTYALRDKSIAIDNRVSSYMTLKLPQPVREGLNVINSKHKLVSPFINHILNDLLTSQINGNLLNARLSNTDIIALCKPYEDIMKFDPTFSNNKLDYRYVTIEPHNLDTVINITIYQYNFLSKVVKLYSNNLIDISSFVSFST